MPVRHRTKMTTKDRVASAGTARKTQLKKSEPSVSAARVSEDTEQKRAVIQRASTVERTRSRVASREKNADRLNQSPDRTGSTPFITDNQVKMDSHGEISIVCVLLRSVLV